MESRHRPGVEARLSALVVALAAAMAACGGEGNPGGSDAGGDEDVSFTKVEGFTEEVRTDNSDGLQGLAWFDANEDERLDLFVTNGIGHRSLLYLNLPSGFVEAGDATGIDTIGHRGVLAADFDGDGMIELWIGGDGGYEYPPPSTHQFLYELDRAGHFVDVTAARGLEVPADQADCRAGAAAGDVDRDGDLDLVVARCSSSFDAVLPSQLYLNDGAGAFTLSDQVLPTDALAVTFSDLDEDGWPDLLVARDTLRDVVLMRNDGTGRFVEVAVPAMARANDWMGFAIADYDGDDDLDVFVTNRRPHGLFRNDGGSAFEDVGAEAGASEFEFAWGCAFADFDLDGWPDLVFGGSLKGMAIGPGIGNPLTLLFNGQDGTFAKRARARLPNLSEFFTSGIAVADYDADGSPDFAIVASSIAGARGGVTLMRGGPRVRAWVELGLRGTTSNRDGIGAQVRLTAGGRTQHQEHIAGTSFLSTHSPWMHFGLGDATAVDEVTVSWPSGLTERFTSVQVGTRVVLTEGQGIEP